MQMEKQLQAPNDMSTYKKVRPFIYLAVLIGALIVFKDVILQTLLLIFVVGCIGFVLYKSVVYLFKFSYLVFRGVLSIFAFVFALGGLMWILNFFN